jgi:predicted DNA-binding protein (MmcQ/YjbR family)
VFKVGGRMFALLRTDLRLSFKCSDVSYHILAEHPGIVPAPYLARAHWVQLAGPGTLPREDLLDYLRLAYGLVLQKLPRAERIRLTAELGARTGRAH